MSIKYLYFFLPKKFDYLNQTKVIKYKEVNLKTSYLINIIHDLILKLYFSNIDIDMDDDMVFNLWSPILRKKYGMHYNIYIDYLIEQSFMSLVSNYYVGKKSKTYKLNYFDLKDIKKVKISDNILLKKNSKSYLEESITSYCKSPIDIDIRKRLVNDLYHVQIDYDKANLFLKKLKDKKDIDSNKYYKNLYSIESIKNKNIFFKFDSYGRFHSNFTVLKKEIRTKYLKIDGQDIIELDIKNSQPLFLGVLLQEEMDPTDPEINNYIWITREGLFYNSFSEKFKELNRKEIKLAIYRVLFGHNGINSKENRIFKELYPKIYDYIIEYKKVNNDYKFLSHKLQKIESDFLYGKVVKELYERIPDIHLFTVHDSIHVPIKYEKQALEIFNRNLNNLF